MTTAVYPVTTVHNAALCSQTLLLDIILYIGEMKHCVFYCFTLIVIFSLTEHGHFRLPLTRLESTDSLIKKQTWQKTLHYFNHNLYLLFSRQR